MNDRDEERKLELANKKLLVELGDIHLQLLRDVGKIIILKYHRKLYDEAKTKFKTIKAEDISEEVRKKAAEIFQTFILINKVYVSKIFDGKFACTNEDLNLLEENCKEVLEKIDAVNKNYPYILSDSECSDAKEGIKKTRRELIPIAREFADINASYRNFDKENFSWQKLKNLYYQAEKESAISRPAEWLSEFAENQKMWFFGEITFATFEGVEEVDKGADMPPNFYPSTAEELNFLQKIADEFPKFLNWSKKKYDSGEIEDIEDKIQWAKEANEKLKTFIQEERKKRGLSASTNKPNSPPKHSASPKSPKRNQWP
ncbi:MAG: hypothetical protein MRECE_14c004 [Mycoplasmataceae bacterium CE_OT135]|nr:MAG: hypothetical protein MRECE_14c004 [Mycoplasmataceae bacterium CE_OT135]